jgi:hypothetical protein
MAHDIKPRELLNFHKVIRSWVGNEDKNKDIESIKKKIKNHLSNLYG